MSIALIIFLALNLKKVDSNQERVISFHVGLASIHKASSTGSKTRCTLRAMLL